MKTKLFLIPILSLFACWMKAENVPAGKALQVATQYYRQLNTTNLRSASVEPLSIAHVEKPGVTLRSSAGIETYYYVFNIENNGGFIIVSGDDRAYPVLGHADRGGFDLDRLPPAMTDWLQMYRKEIESVSGNPDIPRAPEWQALENGVSLKSGELRSSVAPLCAAEWDQGDPYNRECPLYNGQRSVTGCGATAIAIILKYHADQGHPAKGSGHHSYRWLGTDLSVTFGTYDWVNMPNKTGEYRTEAQKAAISRLMYHLGMSINAEYSPGGTNAYGTAVPYALSSYFGFEAREYKYKSQYADSQWIDMIKEELDQLRPVFYRGAGPAGGHFFVFDGYSETGEYHVNWGWDGAGNGHYRLTALQPQYANGRPIGSDIHFTEGQGMVTGIRQATKNADTENGSSLYISDAAGDAGMSMNVAKVEQGKNFTVSVSAITNAPHTKFTGLMQVALMNASGQLKEIVSLQQQQLDIPPGSSLYGFRHECRATQTLSGTDVIRMVSSTDNGNTWKIMYSNLSDVIDFLSVGDQTSVVAVTGVSLDVSSRSLTIGGTFRLVATVSPDNATDRTVSWLSSNAAVAEVDAFGLVTAKAAGTATITVTTEDGNRTATCAITVQPAKVPVTGVSLNVGGQSLTAGATCQLTATVTPASATDKTVAWSSSNTAVAEVNASGLVTAKVVGTAVITVTTADGNKTATCAITVQSATVPVSDVSLNVGNRSLEAGQTFQLTATVSPSDATDKAVSWSSNNGSVASVSTSGLVTANATGMATITVSTVDGNRTAACIITVQPAKVPVTDVSLNVGSQSLTAGATCQLTATVTPASATDKTVAWSSSNAAVAEVNASGLVTAKVAGTATITVTTVNGNKTATCVITVQPATVSVTGVSLNVGNRSLEVGQMFQLTETITPSNATNKAVSWSSSNGNVASVSTAGLVTAKVVGTATITVTTVNGNKTATCVITVQPATVSVTGVSLNVGNRSLEVGQTFQLTETITPSNATNKAVSWSSSNGNVASVSTAGLITAKVAGTATITVTTVNGNKTATCAITVQPANVPVTGVSLNVGNPSLEVGQTFQLTEAITPSNATNKAVSWSSSNGSIASVSTSGLVTANAAGTATITVTTADGNRTAACTVTVTTTLIGGTTGPLTWTFDTNTGKLTISGNGAMPDYGSNGYDAPWYSYRNNIQSIIMNEGVTVISSGAFNGCNISSITIPGSVTAIGSSAFSNCRYLSSITIPANVTSIGTGGFRGQGLTEIHVSVSNQAYTSEDGVLFNKAKTSLLQYPENKSNANYTIPSTVSYIGQIAFFGNHHLTSVSISNSVTGFGNQSFDYMSGLSTVKVGWNPPISYPHGVFQNGVDNNGIYVNDIGAMTLVVPAGTKPLYEAAPGWKDFGTIVEDASLTSGEGNSVNIIEPETIASSDIQVYVSNNRLYISSPSAEQIGVYSVDGALVYSGWKNAGVVTFDIHHLPTGMFIARGSSGWVRKGIILYK